MTNDIVFSNKNLGRNGWFYWALLILVPGPAAFILIFLYSIAYSNYVLLEKSIIAIAALFFFYYLLKGFQVLYLGARTAKEVVVSGRELMFVTYIGKAYKSLSKNLNEARDITDKLAGQHLRLLFPSGCKVLVLTLDNKKYYLPINQSESERGHNKVTDRER